MRQWRLVILLSSELAVFITLVTLDDLRRHVPLFLCLFVLAALFYLPAAIAAMRGRLPFAAVFIIALQLRIPMFLAQPTLSDDVWRYIHDGRAQNAGVNPYLYPPADPRTAAFRIPQHQLINHPELPTIYPPLAQHFFRLAAMFADPLFAWRSILLLAEITILVAGALLLKRRRLPAANLALYAWHPLAIVEGIGSAHLEPIGIAFLALAMFWLSTRARPLAGAALAAAVATKLVAAPLLLFAGRNARTWLVFTLVLAALYLPFLFGGANPLGSLGIFAGSWESNGSIYSLLAPPLSGRAYRVAAAIALIGWLAILLWKGVEFAQAGFAFFLVLFLLSPVVHPWYLLWMLLFVPLRARPLDPFGCAALLWGSTVVLAYSAHQQQLATGVWQIPHVLWLAEYLPVYLLLIIAATARPFSQMKLTAMTRKNPAKM